MKTVTQHIRDHLNSSAPTLAELRESEWSPEFERLMRNRLVVGALRYGLIGAPGKPKWNRTEAIRKRLDAYERDHNAEHLVDIANLCLLEFCEGDATLTPIDDGDHVNERV